MNIKTLYEQIKNKVTASNTSNEIVNAIKFILKNKTLVYFPDIRKNDILIQTVLKSIQNTEFCACIVLDNNNAKEKYIKYSNCTIVTLDAFLATKKVYDIIIFDDIKKLDIYSKCKNTNAKVMFGTTGSPLLFYKLFALKTEFKCCTPVEDENRDRNIYKKIISNSTLVNYNDSSVFFANNKDHDIVKFYRCMKAKEKAVFTKFIENELLCKTTLGKYFKCQIKYESEKITILKAILQIISGKKSCIIVKNSEIKTALGDIITAECDMQKSNNSTILRTYAELGHFEADIRAVIFFNFYPCNIDSTKYILCGQKDKKGLERLIAVEEAIELEVRPSIVMQNLLSVVEDTEVIEEQHAAPKVDKIEYNSSHKFTVYFDDKSGDVEKIDLDKIAKNTVLQNRCMNIWMETPNTLIASFQLSMLYDYPVSYVPTETSSYSYMPCNSFTLGHVNQYNSFVPIEQFKGMGFVFLQSTISIFLFSRKANIRIEIEPKHLEKQLFVNFNASRILLYITTKIPQKVYVVKYVDIRKYEAIKNCQMSQKYELVDELNWQRITANELSAFGKYFDLCLTVNLEQLSKKYRASDLNSDRTYNKLNTIILDTKKINAADKLNDINRYKQPIQSILNKFSSYGVSMCISQITDNSLKGKTIAEIRSELASLDFDSLYYLEILLTKKTNFINHKLADLSIFENNDMEKLTKYLDINLKNRFVPLDGILERYKIVALNSKAYAGEKKYTKQITLTPMRFICEYPDHYDSNRILRNFDPSNFIRVYFKDEDGSLTRNNDKGDNENIYQRIKHYMRTGISLGNRRFFFLAMSSSQLKLHSAWFISPYVMNNQMIGADFVRTWMGDFKEIHNIGKYAIRLGQALSTTIPTIQIVNMQVENDIERNGYVFSDGIGMISPALANEISSYLKVLNVPSAFQIRIGGFKGVVSVYKNRSKSGVNINKQKKKRLLECSEVNLHRQVDDDVVILRKSMQKFSSDHTTLEVVSFSRYTPCRLNRQVILLLEALKINTNVFLEMQDDTIAKNIMKDNKPIAELGNVILKKCFSDERHVLKMKEASINKQFTDLVKKSKIFVCKGRILMGILDEYNVLGENEVFVRVSPCNNCECNSTGPEVITGKVVVSKNPCLHPGDIRIVDAVDYDIFHHLIDVIVFPQRGYRPITNMCSGSDLDGDCYFCVWDERLVPNEMHDPDTYNTANLLYKEVVSIDDIINFYTRFMQGNQLGYIANAHLALSDKLDRGVLEPECIRLANLFSLGVDFPKTGYVANLPHELYPVEYPDFMESAPAYKSQKILGVLYRRCLMVNKLSFPDCECNKKASDYLQCIYDFECRNIYNLAKMKGKINGLKRGIENINQNHIKSNVPYLDNLLAKLEPLLLESKVILKAYKDEQKLILSRNCKLNEYLAVLGPINDEDNKHSALNGIKKLNTKYKRLLHKNVANDKIYHKALAWYITAHENCAYSCTSFGWLGIDILNANINEFMKYKECCSYVTNYTSTGNKNSQKTVVDGIRAQQVLVEEFKLSKKLFIVNKNSPRIFNQSSTKDYYNYKGCRFVYCPLYFELCSQIKDLDIMKEMFAVLYAIRFFTLSTMDTFIEFMSLFSTLLSKDTNRSIVIQLLIELSKFYYRVDEFIANVVKVMTEKELFDVESKDTVSAKNALLRLYEMIHGCSTEENGNKLLLVAYVLSTDHSLGIKLLACENIFFTQSQNKKCTLRNEMKIAKSNKRIELAIIGMFDYSDMIYMEKYDKNIINIHKNHQKYVPLLLNPGKSTYLNYKDELRMFLVNNVWTSRKNNIFIKVRILPGKLYFYNIPNRYSNNNFELKTLVNDLNSVIYDKNNPDLTINSYFLNDIFFVSSHKNASSYVKQKVTEELLFSVMKDGISYFVHYSLKENKVYMVTKNKSFAYAFTLIDSTDVQFNTTHEEIIYSIDMDVNDLIQDEMILLTLGLSKGNDDTLQLSNNVKFFTQLKLYFITSTSYVKDANTKNDMRPCIQLMKRSIYDYDLGSMEFVYVKDTNSCEAISQYKFDTVDFKTIDDFFEKTWLLYEDYFV